MTVQVYQHTEDIKCRIMGQNNLERLSQSNALNFLTS